MSFSNQAGAPPPAVPWGVSSASPLDAQVIACENHAFSVMYSGPFVGGDTFAGWPLSELVKATHPGMSPMGIAMVSAHLMAKHSMRGGSYAASQLKTSPSRPYSAKERLAMRMQWGRVEESTWAPGFEHIAIYSVNGSTTVHVWAITKQGQSVVLEDDAPLFPSDALITKLNMLKE